MNETALKKEWLRLYETKKLPPALAEVKKDIDRVNIYNSELYQELLRLQNADCPLPTDTEMYDIKVKVSGITEDRFLAGSDESRISYDKIMEAVMSSEFLSTISVNENGKVEKDYYFHMKAIIPCTFLTKKEQDVLGTSLGGDYIAEYGVLEANVLNLLANQVISEKERDKFVAYSQRLILEAVSNRMKLEYPTEKVSFKYGLINRVKDYFLDSSTFK